jgi:hypothetical protein
MRIDSRLRKLERQLPKLAHQANIEAAWRKLFIEFNVPQDTSIPHHVPIIISIVDPDRTVQERVLHVGNHDFSKM